MGFILENEDETFDSLMALFKRIENLYQRPISRIRSDNGTEFKNSKMEEFCDERGILHEFSASYTPQQNGVAERKNMTLIETARTMLADLKLPKNFWAEAVFRRMLYAQQGSHCQEIQQNML